MLDLTHYRQKAWPDDIKPIGEGTHEKETFDHWWCRCRSQVNHLHPRIVEQWVHRHWENSYFAFLPLNTLKWRMEVWSTEHLLAEVNFYFENKYDPDLDYEVFARTNLQGNKLPTAVALDEGTWDFPVVVLETPDGFVGHGVSRPHARHVLVEGHLRMRYLSAITCRGTRSGPHELFLIKSDLTV